MADPSRQTTVLIECPDPEQVMREKLRHLARPVPVMRGMNPKQRALALYAELQRRIAEAKEAANA